MPGTAVRIRIRVGIFGLREIENYGVSQHGKPEMENTSEPIDGIISTADSLDFGTKNFL